MRRLKAWHLALTCLILALIGVLHHLLITNGILFQWDQIMHHETFIVCLIALAIGLIIGNNFKKPH
jgi:hypothetical protein